MQGVGIRLRDSVDWVRDKFRGEGVDAVLARGAGAAFMVNALGMGLAFVTQVFFARLLGVTQYGIYIYALTWLNVLILITKFGLDTSLVRYVSAYRAQGQWALLRGILSESVRLIVGASLVVGGLSAAVVWALSDRVGPDQSAAFWLSFLAILPVSLLALRQATLRALKQVIRAGLPDALARPTLLMLMGAIAYFGLDRTLSATDVMIFNIVAAVAAGALAAYWVRRHMPLEVFGATRETARREWLGVSFPMFLINGMHLLLRQTDVLMIGIFMGPEPAAVYAVASRVAELVIFGLAAVDVIYAPMISELYSTDRRQDMQRIVTLAARGIMAFTAVATVFLVLLGTEVLGLFGSEFEAGYVPLVVLLCAQLVNALCGSAGFLMSMTGHQNPLAWIIGVSALINIALNVALIPAFGLIGAAIATAATTSLATFARLVYVRQRLGIDPTFLGGASKA